MAAVVAILVVMADIVCPLCENPPFSTLPKHLRHIRVTHADAETFNIQCTLQGCCRTFRSFKSYRIHIYRHHKTSQNSVLDVASTPAQVEGEYIELDPSEGDNGSHDDLGGSELSSSGKNFVPTVIHTNCYT